MNTQISLLLASTFVFSCSTQDDTPPGEIESIEEGQGVEYDEQNPNEDFSSKADSKQYTVPQWLLDKDLVHPEVRISLDGLSIHLLDDTGFSRVYPTGPGALSSRTGLSVTPTGFFATGSSGKNDWWNISQRFKPSYFGGFPFLRITAKNRNGYATYGLHGPISYTCPDGGRDCTLSKRNWYLRHDYVSHGCMRMRAKDIVELFYLLQGHRSVPVTIQKFVEQDQFGNDIIVGDEAIDWPMARGGYSEDTLYGELGLR